MSIEKLNWSALKNFQCPKCATRLSLLLSCKNPNCDFSISQKKFDVIVSALYHPKRKWKVFEDECRLAELNNDGRKEVAEDFSDSPFL